jgi:NAD(P)-dependent dehydrogenase (short-subunit alcohol dehydrogenase family)
MSDSQWTTLVVRNVYNAWCFLNLYFLGAIYALIEIRRRLQWPWPVRQLNVDTELPADLSQVTALITGGSRGIGLETCRTLLSKGARLIICSSRTDHGLSELEQQLKREFQTLSGTFEVRHLNLSRMESVVELVQSVKDERVKVNLLINNAGIMFCPFQLTDDHFESQLATNYLGHALLTWHLLPVLADNRLVMDGQQFNARVVNVSSSTHYSRNLNLSDLHGRQLYSPFHAYAQSKLAQIMFGYRLVREELSNRGYQVSINAVHPGVVFTSLYQYVGWVNWFPWLAKQMFRVRS